MIFLDYKGILYGHLYRHLYGHLYGHLYDFLDLKIAFLIKILKRLSKGVETLAIKNLVYIIDKCYRKEERLLSFGAIKTWLIFLSYGD